MSEPIAADDAWTGYVVAIRRTRTPSDPTEWLGEVDGVMCIVSDRAQAKVFKRSATSVYPALLTALRAGRKIQDDYPDRAGHVHVERDQYGKRPGC